MILYGVPISCPTRTVTMTMDMIGLDFEFEAVNPLKGDTRKPEFLKLNAQHQIPVFIDGDGFKMNESRAIAKYLAQKYDKSGTLFPDDLKIQAAVNQRLEFDNLVLFEAFFDIFPGLFFGGVTEIPGTKVAAMKKAMDILETLIGASKTAFIAGTAAPTVADFSVLATYTTLAVTEDAVMNLDAWPATKRWAEAVKETLPDYDKANGNGVKVFRDLFGEITRRKTIVILS